MKKYILLSIIGIAVLGCALWVVLLPYRVSEFVPVATVASETPPVAALEHKDTKGEDIHVPSLAPTSAESQASLLVLGHEYTVLVARSGEVLYEVMNNASKSSNFSFSGKDFSGLGFFVDTINGQKNADGNYWILYVNSVLATEGVSQLLVKPGDHIEWRYEKGK